MVILGLDQIAKTIVLRTIERAEIVDLGIVHLVRAFNTGMAFSLGQGSTGLVVVVTLLVGVLIWAARRELRRGDTHAASIWPAVGFGLLIGGALGNLVDRMLRAPGFGRGAVVDFIEVKGFLDFWPIFNVADIALTLGAILLTLLSTRPPDRTSNNRTSNNRTANNRTENGGTVSDRSANGRADRTDADPGPKVGSS
jgi:signal peptidase II